MLSVKALKSNTAELGDIPAPASVPDASDANRLHGEESGKDQ